MLFWAYRVLYYTGNSVNYLQLMRETRSAEMPLSPTRLFPEIQSDSRYESPAIRAIEILTKPSVHVTEKVMRLCFKGLLNAEQAQECNNLIPR